MINIPKSVTVVIEKIRATGAEAYLVGGAIRNQLTGLPVKDWDIMVCGDGNLPRAVKRVTDKLNQSYSIRVCGDEEEYPDEDSAVVKVLRLDVDIDILFRGELSIFDSMECFPCNASKVYVNLQGIVAKTPDYMGFENKKTLIFYGNHPDYVERMVAYYPEYKVVIIPNEDPFAECHE